MVSQFTLHTYVADIFMTSYLTNLTVSVWNTEGKKKFDDIQKNIYSMVCKNIFFEKRKKIKIIFVLGVPKVLWVGVNLVFGEK